MSQSKTLEIRRKRQRGKKRLSREAKLAEKLAKKSPKPAGASTPA